MKILDLTGNADDLFCVDKDGQIESVSVIKLNNKDDINDEPNDLDITLTSFCVDGSNSHKTIDRLRGKKIRFKLEVIDE